MTPSSPRRPSIRPRAQETVVRRLERRRAGSGRCMKAVTWHGKRDVRVESVPDPSIEEPTDIVLRVTSSGLCGSDLHLYELFGPFMDPGDVLGHEPMGVVEAVGSSVTSI